MDANTQGLEGLDSDHGRAHAAPPYHSHSAVLDQSSEPCDGCNPQDLEGFHLDYAPAHIAPSQHN